MALFQRNSVHLHIKISIIAFLRTIIVIFETRRRCHSVIQKLCFKIQFQCLWACYMENNCNSNCNFLGCLKNSRVFVKFTISNISFYNELSWNFQSSNKLVELAIRILVFDFLRWVDFNAIYESFMKFGSLICIRLKACQWHSLCQWLTVKTGKG